MNKGTLNAFHFRRFTCIREISSMIPQNLWWYRRINKHISNVSAIFFVYANVEQLKYYSHTDCLFVQLQFESTLDIPTDILLKSNDQCVIFSFYSFFLLYFLDLITRLLILLLYLMCIHIFLCQRHSSWSTEVLFSVSIFFNTKLIIFWHYSNFFICFASVSVVTLLEHDKWYHKIHNTNTHSMNRILYKNEKTETPNTRNKYFFDIPYTYTHSHPRCQSDSFENTFLTNQMRIHISPIHSQI